MLTGYGHLLVPKDKRKPLPPYPIVSTQDHQAVLAQIGVYLVHFGRSKCQIGKGKCTYGSKRPSTMGIYFVRRPIVRMWKCGNEKVGKCGIAKVRKCESAALPHFLISAFSHSHILTFPHYIPPPPKTSQTPWACFCQSSRPGSSLLYTAAAARG